MTEGDGPGDGGTETVAADSCAVMVGMSTCLGVGGAWVLVLASSAAACSKASSLSSKVLNLAFSALSVFFIEHMHKQNVPPAGFERKTFG